MRALVVVGLLLAGGTAAADPPADQGEQLVASDDYENARHRLLCGSKFCAWESSQYLGGCSGEDCSAHQLVVTDLKDRALGAFWGRFELRTAQGALSRLPEGGANYLFRRGLLFRRARGIEEPGRDPPTRLGINGSREGGRTEQREDERPAPGQGKPATPSRASEGLEHSPLRHLGRHHRAFVFLGKRATHAFE